MRYLYLFVVAVVIVLAGCSKGSATASGQAEAKGGSDETAILASADAADGTVDHVVSRCAVCTLAMDGSAEHASTHAGYEFHLCSARCKETFDHDPAKVLARLEPKT